MPTQRLSMRRIREVLRLRHQGLTERVIARMLDVSSGVVHSYVRRARLAGLNWPLRRAWTMRVWSCCCFQHLRQRSQSDRRLASDWIYVEKELLQLRALLMLACWRTWFTDDCRT